MRSAVLAALIVTVVALRVTARAAVTYANDIAPLIADRCATCHHDGGPAPFALETYADVKQRAALIASVTKSRYMPPWKADPSNGPFVGQHPLSDAEIRIFQEWATQGVLEGAAKADLSRRSGEGGCVRRGIGGCLQERAKSHDKWGDAGPRHREIVSN